MLEKLYIEKRLSPYKIAPLVGCNFGTVSNRIKEYGIPLRSKSQAQMKYEKRDFSGNATDAAYLLGFRRGDLNVYIPKAKHSEILVVRCHTTDLVQVRLMKEIFRDYSHVQISKSSYGYNINCYLNHSFSFLMPKDRVETFIRKDNKCAAAFIAGYIDAEGNFILNQGRARFKLDSYDLKILRWIYNWFRRNGICSILRQIAKKGDPQGKGMIYNQDLWRININEARSLKKTIYLLLPYLKHERRLRQAKLMLRNIDKRLSYGTI